jgi:hypothetical protein
MLEIAGQEGFEKAAEAVCEEPYRPLRILGHDLLYLCRSVPGTDDAYIPTRGGRFKEASEDPVERMKGGMPCCPHAVHA